MNPFRLLREKRFGPFFWTQFLGAFNDNVYKNALIILIAFELGAGGDGEGHIMINAAAGLFILPFLLFSATAGQLADKYEKSLLMRRIKLAEIIIMMFAAAALIMKSAYALIGLLFLMGAQSSIFGPVKYAILPQHLHEDELVGGNGLVEMGTFVAILFGTLVGGLLIAIEGQGHVLVALAVVGLAVLGWWASRAIPAAPTAAPDLQLNWNFVSASWTNLRHLASHRLQWVTALGISWFWFYGATLLTQIPNFTRLSLSGDERVVTALLTAFSVGIGLGSLMVESLSRRRIVVAVSLIGGLGMTVFGLAVPWLVGHSSQTQELQGFFAFLQNGGGTVLLAVVLLGFFGGLYIVPLFALIQRCADDAHRSRVIAGVNILNALFMVLSAVVAAVVLGRGLSVPQLFSVVALLNFAVLVLLTIAMQRSLGGLGVVKSHAFRNDSRASEVAAD